MTNRVQQATPTDIPQSVQHRMSTNMRFELPLSYAVQDFGVDAAVSTVDGQSFWNVAQGDDDDNKGRVPVSGAEK